MVRASPARADIRIVTSAREEELPALMASASVLVELADEALTAVTPLEAMSLGLEVVAMRLPAFEEALGEHAHWVGREELEAGTRVVAGTLARAIDSACSAERRAARLELAAGFTWERQARETVAHWQTILARSGRA